MTEQKLKITKDIVILYHGNCADGFGAAWAAWEKFGDDVAYIPVHHGKPIPEGLMGKTIYMLDFAFPRDETLELIKNNIQVTAIDHHKTKEAEIRMTKDYSFALDHSGAVLAWKYFHPKETVPLLLRYLEDADMWWHKMPHWSEVQRYVSAISKDFNAWSILANELDDSLSFERIIKEGKLISDYEENIYRELLGQAYLVSFEGYEIYAVNAPGWFRSGLAQMLYTKKPPFAIVWQDRGDKIRVSLRSDGTIDVPEMAKKYSSSGGGHSNAAAFTLEQGMPLPWKKIK